MIPHSTHMSALVNGAKWQIPMHHALGMKEGQALRGMAADEPPLPWRQGLRLLAEEPVVQRAARHELLPFSHVFFTSFAPFRGFQALSSTVSALSGRFQAISRPSRGSVTTRSKGGCSVAPMKRTKRGWRKRRRASTSFFMACFSRFKPLKQPFSHKKVVENG